MKRRPSVVGPASLGKYHVIACLSRGGTADVYLTAKLNPLGVPTLQVVKQLRPNLAEEPEFLGMFRDEARLAARLNHPNIVHTLEVGETEHRHFIVMEYLDAISLHAAAHRIGGKLPLPIGLRIVSDVLSGLQYAHDLADYDGKPLRVVHRDVTPGNILVTFDGQTKLVDFGIAKATLHSTQTRIGMIKGKAGYIAPEQALGESVDRRADIFAAGALLWEIVAGRRLRESNDVHALDGLLRPAPPLRQAVSGAPASLDAICARSLALDPAERYASALEMQRDLERASEECGGIATSRQLGAWVQQHFASERATMRALVSDGVRALTEDLEGGATRVMGRVGAIPGAPSLRVERGSIPPEPTSVSLAPAARDRKTVRALLGFGAFAAAAVFVAGATVHIRTLTRSQRPAQASSNASTELAPAPSGAISADASNTIEVRITADPTGAQIFLDGAEVDANPYRGVFARDDASHRVVVVRNGFERFEQAVSFSKDVQLIVMLKRADREVPMSGPARPPPPASPAPDKRARPIDTGDPWGPRRP